MSPRRHRAARWTDYKLFGVRGQSGELVRYDFAASHFTSVGSIRTGEDQLLTGIEAIGYMPRNLNLYGFSPDPADGQSRLVYINSVDATATFVGEPLGPGSVTGATVCTALNGGTGASSTAFGAGDPTPVSVVRDQRFYAVQTLSTAAGPATAGATSTSTRATARTTSSLWSRRTA